MDLIAKDFYFYSDVFINNTKYDIKTSKYYTDLENYIPSIRIFGTKEQVEKAKNKYIKDTGYCLDEVYDYKVETKGSYYYDFYSNPEKRNKEVKTKLEYYKKMYKQNNNKTLIIGI
tara:strand:+ start:186 stop:533 length:348 start_codon:yes stop_codon:yes gene_type:complete